MIARGTFRRSELYASSTVTTPWPPYHYTWLAMILPYIEQMPLYTSTNWQKPCWGQPIVGAVVPTLLCPSDAGPVTDPTQTWGIAVTCYAGASDADWYGGVHTGYGSYISSVIGGTSECTNNDLENVFGYPPDWWYPIRCSNLNAVTDGTSCTAIVGECNSTGWQEPPNFSGPYMGDTSHNRGVPRLVGAAQVFRAAFVCPTGPGYPWSGQCSYPDGSGVASNWFKTAPYASDPMYILAWGQMGNWCSPGGSHPATVNYTFADGSVHGLSKTIDFGVWVQINAMSDGLPISAGNF